MRGKEGDDENLLPTIIISLNMCNNSILKKSSKIFFLHFLKIFEIWVNFAEWKNGVGKLKLLPHYFGVIFQLLWPPAFADFQKKWEILHILYLGELIENWARVSTNVGSWLSRRDRNITRNITLAPNASFSNWCWRVSIDFIKKYLVTFFIGNFTRYIS